MIPKKFIQVLKFLEQTFKKNKIPYVLVGSICLSLQKVKVKPSDIDLMTTKSGAYKINGILKKYIIKEVKYGKTDKFQSHFGEFKINGIKVEVMGDFQVKRDGRWHSLSSRFKTKRLVKVGSAILPVTRLKEILDAYKTLNRPKDLEKVKKIKEAILKQ